MIINGIEFKYSDTCQEYQYQACNHDEYIEVRKALLDNGWKLNDVTADYAYFINVNKLVYVERNYL